MPLTFPKINGHQFSHSSIEVTITNGNAVKVLSQFSEIKYSHSLEPGKVRGQNAEAFGRTRGEYDAEGSLTMIKKVYVDLIQALGDGYLEKSFDITVMYNEENEDQVTDKLFGCRIKKPETSSSAGQDATNVSVDLDVMRLEEGGLTPIKNMLR